MISAVKGAAGGLGKYRAGTHIPVLEVEKVFQEEGERKGTFQYPW